MEKPITVIFIYYSSRQKFHSIMTSYITHLNYFLPPPFRTTLTLQELPLLLPISISPFYLPSLSLPPSLELLSPYLCPSRVHFNSSLSCRLTPSLSFPYSFFLNLFLPPSFPCLLPQQTQIKRFVLQFTFSGNKRPCNRARQFFRVYSGHSGQHK